MGHTPDGKRIFERGSGRTKNEAQRKLREIIRDYAGVFENYAGSGMYLDAAAWVALGDVQRAASLLRARLAHQSHGFMGILMASLLAVLDGQRAQVLAIRETLPQLREPEGVFYFARHFAMLEAPGETMQVLRLARRSGFWCSYCLENDPVFAPMRECPEYVAEIEQAKRLEHQARSDVRDALGPALAETISHSPPANETRSAVGGKAGA